MLGTHRRRLLPSNSSGTIGLNHFTNSSSVVRDLIWSKQFCHISQYVCVLFNMMKGYALFLM